MTDYNMNFSDVTIGIPVFNEKRFVSQTIESAIAQKVRIIISDNASTDGTSDICREYVKRHPCLTYVRHQSNMGALSNFVYCLDVARTKYFMWLGGHDVLPSDYCKKLKYILDESDETVLAYAPVKYVNDAGIEIKTHAFPELIDCESKMVASRVRSIVCSLVDYTIIQGLHRTKTLKRCVLRIPMPGPDGVIMAREALCGKFSSCSDTSYIRRVVREGYDDQDRMVRLTGIAKFPYDTSLLCNELLRVLLHTPESGALRRFLFLRYCLDILAARYRWLDRYRKLSMLVHYIVRGPRAIPQFF